MTTDGTTGGSAEPAGSDGDGADGGDGPAGGGIVRDWVVPIVLGLALGGGLVAGWGALQSPASKLVASWDPADYEHNEQLAEEIRKLGRDAREDLLKVFRGLEVGTDGDGTDERKMWAADLLAREPFFDTRSLIDIVKDPGAPLWDRRAAASALVEVLRKDVDPTAVVPILLEWLEDLTVIDHTTPLVRLKMLRHDQVLPPGEDGRWKAAVMRLADGATREKPADEWDLERLVSDRMRAVFELGDALPDADAKDLLWRIAADEADHLSPRVAAVRTLAQGLVFDDPEPWERVGASTDVTVRQTVAENLLRTPDPVYDGMLTAFHSDAGELVRSGSIDTQQHRGRPTMLPILGRLIEDHSSAVRGAAIVACGTFKNHVDGIGERQGMLLRVLETSDSDEDVGNAVLALRMMTGQHFGFGDTDVDVSGRMTDPAACAAFRSDAEGRARALEKWRAHLGGAAVWPDARRREALEALLAHADPANVERAKAELAKLR